MLSLQHLFREVHTLFGYIDPLLCAVLLRPRLAQPRGQPAVDHAHAVNGAPAVLAPLLRQARGRGLLVPRHEGVNPLRGGGLPARPRGLAASSSGSVSLWSSSSMASRSVSVSCSSSVSRLKLRSRPADSRAFLLSVSGLGGWPGQGGVSDSGTLHTVWHLPGLLYKSEMSEGEDLPENESSYVRFLFFVSSCSFFMASSFSMLLGSVSQSCILMKGSRPLMLSMCHGLGLENSSETEPWLSPATRPIQLH